MRPFLPFHLPKIEDDDIQSVVETLRSGWLTTGSKAKQFEEEFGRYIGTPYAVAVNSCTAALHLALEAVGVTSGDEVIVPTMTFAATAEVVHYLKAKPVLVDCEEDTLTIDVELIEKAISPRTKAIIPVHFAGQPCLMDRILEIAHRHRLYVIEDAAHALPARCQGRMVGTLGDITCFSFYATKTITTGEGGMATTHNEEWAEKMRVLSLHGITREAVNRYTPTGSWYYEIEHAGYKYNLTDVAAALGLSQLKKSEMFGGIRAHYAELYHDGLRGIPELRLPSVRDGDSHAWHLYVIQLELERLRIGRNEFIEHLKKKGIGVSVHFIPLHLHSFYRKTYGYRQDDLPIASQAYERVISLPIYPKMNESDVYYVIDAIKDIVREFRR